MKLYKSCNTLSIARYMRIIKTDDLRELIIDFDKENDELTLSEEQVQDMDGIFSEIVYEYADLTNNIRARRSLKLRLLISKWSIKYDIVVNAIRYYLETDDQIYLKNLYKIGYPIDFDKEILPQLDVIGKKMKGLNNKIKIYKINLAKLFKDDKIEVKVDLDKQALYLESNLELKREIDPEQTSISKWVKLMDFNEQKIKQHGRN